MERTIDRTSYRRSVRNHPTTTEREENTATLSKKFQLSMIFLDQIIISLLMILEVLVLQYYDKTEIISWFANQMAVGPSAQEVVAFFQNHFANQVIKTEMGTLSGEKFSGEKQPSLSGEQQSEESGELISAVEGLNQMAEDVTLIQNAFHLTLPLTGTITSHFGCRESAESMVSTYHTGLDIATQQGTEIHAAHGGKVSLAENYASYGNCVIIEEGNLSTLYAHCSSLQVAVGQMVTQGETIAKVGMTGNATGPHLHFEIKYEGRWVDPEKVLVWE